MLFLKEHDCTFPPKTTHLPQRTGGVKEDNTPPPKSGVCKGRQHTPPKREGRKREIARKGRSPLTTNRSTGLPAPFLARPPHKKSGASGLECHSEPTPGNQSLLEVLLSFKARSIGIFSPWLPPKTPKSELVPRGELPASELWPWSALSQSINMVNKVFCRTSNRTELKIMKVNSLGKNMLGLFQ